MRAGEGGAAEARPRRDGGACRSPPPSPPEEMRPSGIFRQQSQAYSVDAAPAPARIPPPASGPSLRGAQHTAPRSTPEAFLPRSPPPPLPSLASPASPKPIAKTPTPHLPIPGAPRLRRRVTAPAWRRVAERGGAWRRPTYDVLLGAGAGDALRLPRCDILSRLRVPLSNNSAIRVSTFPDSPHFPSPRPRRPRPHRGVPARVLVRRPARNFASRIFCVTRRGGGPPPRGEAQDSAPYRIPRLPRLLRLLLPLRLLRLLLPLRLPAAAAVHGALPLGVRVRAPRSRSGSVATMPSDGAGGLPGWHGARPGPGLLLRCQPPAPHCAVRQCRSAARRGGAMRALRRPGRPPALGAPGGLRSRASASPSHSV